MKETLSRDTSETTATAILLRFISSTGHVFLVFTWHQYTAYDECAFHNSEKVLSTARPEAGWLITYPSSGLQVVKEMQVTSDTYSFNNR